MAELAAGCQRAMALAKIDPGSADGQAEGIWFFGPKELGLSDGRISQARMVLKWVPGDAP
jgi:hypothetical protein